jgi:SHAQKYF class myb-like DNA-binding protein
LYIEAVPRRILEKMNEKMNVPEVSREKVASHLQVIIIIII